MLRLNSTPITGRNLYSGSEKHTSRKRTIRTLKTMQLLFVIMPSHYLINGNVCIETIKLKILPFGMATLYNKTIIIMYICTNVLSSSEKKYFFML